MPGFIDDQALQKYVAAVLHRSGVAVTTDVQQSTFWPAIVSQANLAAYNEIFDRLIRRGWTPAQIAAWDRGAEVQTAIGAFNAVRDGGFLDQVQTAILENLKRYFDETNPKNVLDNTLVTNSQQWQIPGDAPGTVGTGALDTSQDMFVMPGPQDDPRIGQITRW